MLLLLHSPVCIPVIVVSVACFFCLPPTPPPPRALPCIWGPLSGIIHQRALRRVPAPLGLLTRPRSMFCPPAANSSTFLVSRYTAVFGPRFHLDSFTNRYCYRRRAGCCWFLFRTQRGLSLVFTTDRQPASCSAPTAVFSRRSVPTSCSNTCRDCTHPVRRRPNRALGRYTLKSHALSEPSLCRYGRLERLDAAAEINSVDRAVRYSQA